MFASLWNSQVLPKEEADIYKILHLKCKKKTNNQTNNKQTTHEKTAHMPSIFILSALTAI